jgi:predicted regulator of Ras-like GTPase activity (Roadblock/LC7/MglB family)
MSTTLPQLIEEDIDKLNSILNGYLEESEATAGIVIDKGGFHITSCGSLGQIDITTLGAMASACYAATQQLAGLVEEPDFDCVYQQGNENCILIRNIGEYSLLVIVFTSKVGVGAVKYYAENIVDGLTKQFETAYERDPGSGLDLSVLNSADTSGFFKKKGA